MQASAGSPRERSLTRPIRDAAQEPHDGQRLFLRSEESKHRHTQTIDHVSRFLGARELRHDAPETIFATPAARMPAADRRFLQSLHAPGLARLERILGGDPDRWTRQKAIWAGPERIAPPA